MKLRKDACLKEEINMFSIKRTSLVIKNILRSTDIRNELNFVLVSRVYQQDLNFNFVFFEAWHVV